MNIPVKMNEDGDDIEILEEGEGEVKQQCLSSTDPNQLNTERCLNTERNLVTKSDEKSAKSLNAANSSSQKIQRVAGLKLWLEDMVICNQRFSTLFIGLKLNTERNSAIAEPLLFLTRRIVYAAALVYLQNSPQIMIGILIAMSLVALVFNLLERPWKEAEMNYLAIANEVFLYSLLVLVFLAISIDEEA